MAKPHTSVLIFPLPVASNFEKSAHLYIVIPPIVEKTKTLMLRHR